MVAMSTFGATTATAAPAKTANAAIIREFSRVFPTDPFNDPNPIPNVGRIYPYFRFDGFAKRAEQKSWKVVELENDYSKVMILPEIGGKIWNALEKRTGKSFIYFNQSVKFRDIATPVDYTVRTTADGRVTCVIGALDLPTRTPRRFEVRQGQDDAAFHTTSLWYNASPRGRAWAVTAQRREPRSLVVRQQPLRRLQVVSRVRTGHQLCWRLLA